MYAATLIEVSSPPENHNCTREKPYPHFFADDSVFSCDPDPRLFIFFLCIMSVSGFVRHPFQTTPIYTSINTTTPYTHYILLHLLHHTR